MPNCEFVSMLISERASLCVSKVSFGICDDDGNIETQTNKKRKESFTRNHFCSACYYLCLELTV